jgi:hypothetical protein
MENRKKPNKNEPVFDASQIGDLEAMHIAAFRGLTLKDVGVKPTLKNRIDFARIRIDVKRISKQNLN